MSQTLWVLMSLSQLLILPSQHESSIDNTKMNESGCVQMKTYLWTLGVEFNIIFTYHKYHSSFDSSHPFKYAKTILTHKPYKNQHQARFTSRPQAIVCPLLSQNIRYCQWKMKLQKQSEFISWIRNIRYKMTVLWYALNKRQKSLLI